MTTRDNRHPKPSLYHNLATTIVISVIVIMASYSGYRYLVIKESVIEQMKQRSQLTLNALQLNMAPLLEAYAIHEYEQLLETEIKQQHHFALIVEDFNMGQLLGKTAYMTGKMATTDGSLTDYDPDSLPQQRALQAIYYQQSLPIHSPSDDTLLARITIYIDDNALNRELQQLIMQHLVISIALTLLLIATLFASIRRIVFAPLSGIIDYISNSGEGGVPQQAIPEQKYREIALLASAMNQMVDSIKASKDELQHQHQQLLKNESQLRQKSIELSQLNETLEERVEQRTQELSAANQELELLITTLKKTQNELIEAEKMASLGGLVAGIAHEINTPIGVGLTGMSHFDEEIQQLKLKYEQGELEEHDFKEFLDTSAELSRTILASLHRAADQVRSFKRIAVDQSHTEIQTFSLKEYVDEVLLSLRNRLKQTQHQIKLEIDPKLEMTSDPGSISQVITNLITNSLLHGFEPHQWGEITLSAKPAQSPQQLEITYRDNGKGIAPQHRNKIFEPFFTTRRNSGGTGLGLNIIYNVVTQRLKGTIKVSHPEQGGVEFRLVLPQTLTPKPEQLPDM
ncbi:hypothetical protein D5085_03255 [Ectothiorhodospiraceae bacterium BW-2]|nr:hypothetical protein D5085_03255 [Ectothiorhodospiraceae bacterium BW-2]